MSKQIKRKSIILGLTTMLLFGGLGVWSTQKMISPNGDLVTNETSKGVTVKKLSSGTNSEGQTYVTYSYTVTPDYATNKDIVVKSLEFTDTSVEDTPSKYVDVKIDNSSSTFTVTQLADFSNQLTLTLASQINSAATAVIKIDCKQKWLGFTEQEEYTFYNSSSSATQSSYDIQLAGLVDAGYTDTYTIEIEHPQASVINRETLAAYECYSNSLNGDYVTTANDILSSSDEQLVIFKKYASNYINGKQFSFNDSTVFRNEINEKWTDEKKLEIMNYKYYGFCIVQNVTMSLNNQEKIIKVKTYLSYYVSSFSITIKPTSLTVEQNQIIF